MESLYSRIIWGEMGRKDFKIHTADPKDVEKMILDWFRKEDMEKVENLIFEMSWISKTTFETYYDGPFYGFSQQDDEELMKQEGHKCNILLHDIAMVPTILEMSLRTGMSPSELRLIADILEIFYSRLDKKEPTCRLSSSMNHETFGYKLQPALEKTNKKMKAKQITAFLLVSQEEVKSDSYWLDPKMIPVFQEIESLGLIKSESPIGSAGKTWHVTPEGEKFLSILESAGEYYTANRQVKQDAAELMEKAKTKWNSVMDALKF